MPSLQPADQRLSRIADMILRINAKPRQWTRQALAYQYDVSERQITKDLDVVRQGLEMDLANDRGKGYYFTGVPRLPVLSYSLTEALALYLAAQAGSQFAGIPLPELAAAIGRLQSVMPKEFRPFIEGIDALHPTAAPNQHRESVLQTLYRAISRRYSVDIYYKTASRPDDLTHRKVDPYAVIPSGKSWYLIGHCHLRRSVRIFKLDRITSPQMTRYPFEQDEEFDLDTFMSSGWGVTRIAGQPSEHVELIFDRLAATWVIEEDWHHSQQFEWLDKSRCRFSLEIPVTDEFTRWVLSFGSRCEVSQPAHLKERIQTEARKLLDA